MKMPPLSAADTMARDLGWALARLAEGAGLPAVIEARQLENMNRLLKPPAVRKIMRKEREIMVAALADRGFKLVDYVDQGRGRGLGFTVERMCQEAAAATGSLTAADPASG